MKYVTGLAGIGLIIYLLSLPVVSVSRDLYCRVMISGSDNVYNYSKPSCLPDFMYYGGLALGGIFFLFSAMLVAKDIFAGANDASGTATATSPVTQQNGSSVQASRKTAKTAPAYDVAAWNALVELDPEIGEAARKAREFGPRYEELLAEKFMPLKDKAYLQAALNKVIEAAEEDRRPKPVLDTSEFQKQYPHTRNADGGITIKGGKFVGMKFADAESFIEFATKPSALGSS